MKQQGLRSFDEQKRHLFYDEPKPFDNKMLQIIKIFDGLFIGNQHAGKYSQFTNNNKVSLIINSAPQELKVQKIKHIEIMSYDFYDKDGDMLQTLNINIVLDIIAKIDSILTLKCQTAVIISKNIDSKAISIAILYLMIKYKWDYSYSLSFLQNKNCQLNISHQYSTLLDKFNKNSDRFKLSEAFATDFTEEEETLLKNTFRNSIVINFPNFHGLEYSKEQKQQKQIKKDHDSFPKAKKVFFLQNSQDKKDSKYLKYLKKAIQGDQMKELKLLDIQKKLKMFIKERSYIKQNKNEKDKVSKLNDSQNDMIMIKNKEISRKIVGKRRVVSRTQQSVKEQTQISKYNNYLNIKTEDKMQNDKNISFYNKDRVNSRLQNLSFIQQKNRQIQTYRKNSDKMYVIHNNKRFKTSKRCHTQQPINGDFYSIDNFKEEQDIQKLNQNFIISKSNKSSSKKIKVHENNLKKFSNHSNMTKISQNSIKMTQYEDLSRYWLQNSAIKIGKVKDKEDKERNITNVNVNVQIQNYNVVSDKTQRILDQYKRNNYRVFHSKKLTKRLVQ